MGYNKTVVVWVFGQQMICWPLRWPVALGLRPLATVHLQGQQIICCPQTQSTTVYYWPVNRALLTGQVTNDVIKRQMSRRQRRASAYCWQYFGDLKQLGNKTVISRLLGEKSNNCPSVVEKICENVALGLRPLATVFQIYMYTVLVSNCRLICLATWVSARLP